MTEGGLVAIRVASPHPFPLKGSKLAFIEFIVFDSYFDFINSSWNLSGFRPNFLTFPPPPAPVAQNSDNPLDGDNIYTYQKKERQRHYQPRPLPPYPRLRHHQNNQQYWALHPLSKEQFARRKNWIVYDYTFTRGELFHKDGIDLNGEKYFHSGDDYFQQSVS